MHSEWVMRTAVDDITATVLNQSVWTHVIERRAAHICSRLPSLSEAGFVQDRDQGRPSAVLLA